MRICKLFLVVIVICITMLNIWYFDGKCYERENNKTRVYTVDDEYIYGFRDSEIQIIKINNYNNMGVKSIIDQKKKFYDVNVSVFEDKLFFSGIREERGKKFLDVLIYSVFDREKPHKLNELSIECNYYFFNESNGKIYLLLDNNGNSNVIYINLNNEKNDYDLYEFNCIGNKFMYISENNLYVVCNEINLHKKFNTIYKFNTNNGMLNYVNKLNIDGNVISEKFIDEYMGDLRVTVLCDDEKNKIYILNKDLEILNSIENDEFKNINNIYFDKNFCYIYSLLDGYFSVYDLSNSKFDNVSVLKVPSFINKICKVNDDSILVIGNECRGNTYKNLQSDNVYEIIKNVGIKLMLIDIRDKKDMKVIDEYLIKGKQVYSSCFLDESKFLYFRDKDILIFPIDVNNYNNDLDINSIMEVNNNFNKDIIFDHGNIFNGIYGFNINNENGIDLKFIVDNYKEFKMDDYIDIDFINISKDNLFVFTQDCLKIFNFSGVSLGSFNFKK